MRTVPSLVGRQISRVPDGRERRSVPRRSHQNPAARAQGTARHEDGHGNALGIRDRQRIGQIVDVPVVEGHDNPRTPRRSGQIGKGRRLTVPSDLVELRSEIGGGHAESEGVSDTFGDAVVAENQEVATLHGTFVTRIGSQRPRTGKGRTIPFPPRVSTHRVACYPGRGHGPRDQSIGEPVPRQRAGLDRIDSPYSSGHPAKESHISRQSLSTSGWRSVTPGPSGCGRTLEAIERMGSRIST